MYYATKYPICSKYFSMAGYDIILNYIDNLEHETLKDNNLQSVHSLTELIGIITNLFFIYSNICLWLWKSFHILKIKLKSQTCYFKLRKHLIFVHYFQKQKEFLENKTKKFLSDIHSTCTLKLYLTVLFFSLKELSKYILQ